MLPRDTYRQPDAPDPVLESRTVLELARRHVPSASSVTYVDESGGEARAYFLDEDVVFKVQRPHRLRPRTNLEKEAFFLNQLEGCPEISVPRVLGYGKEGSVEYLCLTRMDGVAAQSVEIEGAGRTELMHRLGEALRRIHSLPQERFHASPLFPGVRSRAAFVDRVRTDLDEAVRAIQDDPELWPFTAAPEEVAAEVLDAVPAQFDLVALHSNPGPEHTFVDPVTFEFTGLIDFGDAYIGHPATDCRWPRQEDRLALLDTYLEGRADADQFMVVWRAVRILSDMSAIAGRPDRRRQALESLAHLIGNGSAIEA